MKKLRIILGVFFLLIAILGSIGVILDFFEIDYYKADNHFTDYSPKSPSIKRRRANAENVAISGAAASNAPIFYSASLIVSVWLLFGKRND